MVAAWQEHFSSKWFFCLLLKKTFWVIRETNSYIALRFNINIAILQNISHLMYKRQTESIQNSQKYEIRFTIMTKYHLNFEYLLSVSFNRKHNDPWNGFFKLLWLGVVTAESKIDFCDDCYVYELSFWLLQNCFNLRQIKIFTNFQRLDSMRNIHSHWVVHFGYRKRISRRKKCRSNFRSLATYCYKLLKFVVNSRVSPIQKKMRHAWCKSVEK